jgi:hypothetical protein
MMGRYPDPVSATRVAPTMQPAVVVPAHLPAQVPVRRKGRFRRFLGALFALVLLMAVPVITAYVAYKLSSGENPFEWPPSMDLSRVF